MHQGQASRTAIGAAGHRAAHQVLERGIVFADPLALAILGQDADEAIALAKEKPERRPLRFFIAMRSRFAEDMASRAMAKGVRQILVLGAGLDTFAYRVQGAEDLKVFELDHPATQRDKRRRLADAEIAEPAHVAYVAHDFERGGMTEALKAAGLKPSQRTFVLWLGVTPYLTEDAVFATLGELAELPGGVEVVFDYANPPHTIEHDGDAGFSPRDGREGGGQRRTVSLLFRNSAICTPARAGSVSARSKISTARRLPAAIFLTFPSLPGRGRAATWCGWRRGRTSFD